MAHKKTTQSNIFLRGRLKIYVLLPDGGFGEGGIRDGEIVGGDIEEGGCEENFLFKPSLKNMYTCRFTMPSAVAMLNFISCV